MGKHDQILELAIDYVLRCCYLLYKIVKTTTTNRAVRKTKLLRKGCQVKVVSTIEEQAVDPRVMAHTKVLIAQLVHVYSWFPTAFLCLETVFS